MRAALSRTIAAFLAWGAMASLAAPPAADWERFKQSFVDPDGRVVDAVQGGISHSEGQGFAMLFAVHHGDRDAFERLWRWTRRNLQVRDDALLAWRWEPQRGVTDRNDATDGDLLVAWALWRAAAAWERPEYATEARRIARDVRTRAMRRGTHGLVLLPGLEGFDKPDGAVLNLSYWVFPALAELDRADPAPEWAEVSRNGLEILGYSYFGRWGLPPDWLKLGDRVAPAGPSPQRFGYDAVRIPLYLLWSGLDTDARMKPYRDFWGTYRDARELPAFTNLGDDSVDSRGAAAGIRAVAQWVLARPAPAAEALPLLETGDTYYSAVLLLLCKMALRERQAH
ncbi:MAG TPA: glycosyl hydrolase family 8 [Usitatibacter sp.]|nr:glycosyl hydrolase family 8 [Usitatibacter sp.]